MDMEDFCIKAVICFLLALVGVGIYNIYESNADYNYTQNLVNKEIQQVEKDGYLKEDEKAIIGNKLNNKDIPYEITGTSTKVTKGSRVFIDVQLHSANFFGRKNILVTGTAN